MLSTSCRPTAAQISISWSAAAPQMSRASRINPGQTALGIDTHHENMRPDRPLLDRECVLLRGLERSGHALAARSASDRLRHELNFDREGASLFRHAPDESAADTHALRQARRLAANAG